MNKISQLVSLSALSLSLTLACSDDTAPKSVTENESTPIGILGGPVAAFSMSWAPPADFSPAEAAYRAAALMAKGTHLVREDFEREGDRFVSDGKRWSGDEIWSERPSSNYPDLYVNTTRASTTSGSWTLTLTRSTRALT